MLQLPVMKFFDSVCVVSFCLFCVVLFVVSVRVRVRVRGRVRVRVPVRAGACACARATVFELPRHVLDDVSCDGVDASTTCPCQ